MKASLVSTLPAQDISPLESILLLGINHKVAPVDLRERFAYSPEAAGKALSSLLSQYGCEDCKFTEAVILSTCNRCEIYLSTTTPSEAEVNLAKFLAGHTGLPAAQVRELLYVRRGREAAAHLFQVAAGLDSLVLGENEILGQVKVAYEIAHAAGASGPVLSTLFRLAVQAGKRVRSETDLNRVGLSVATLAAELAEELFGSLNRRTALLIGAGKISSIAAHALVKAGLHFILVSNRTYERAEKLAQTLHGRAVRFDALVDSLAEADIVICSTSAPHTVLHVKEIELSRRSAPERPLLVIDLAVPRDVDPEVAHLAGVQLVDIDCLEELVSLRHPVTVKTRQAVEQILQAELDHFESWCYGRRSTLAIRELQEKAQEICRSQVEQTIRYMGELTPQQRKAVESLGRAITGKLLYEMFHLQSTQD